ncbi:MAG: T9SS type A sorting domain-containing protein [bacterium]|nr:T9SS type A sorting domain-containing protein [bacterium]
MKRLVVIGAIVALIAMIPPTKLQAQNAWNVDSVGFERNWPDSLVGQFLNINVVLPLPWGGTAYAVRGMTQQSLLGVWIQDTDGNWSHPYLPVPTGITRSISALVLAEDADGSTVLLAGTDNGPYASVDSGRTWQPRNGLTVQQLDEGERSWWSEVGDIYDEGNGHWWAISPFDGPAFSDNYGLSWQLVIAGLNARQRHPDVFNTGLIYQGSDDQIWLQGEDALYHLDRPDIRDGNTWQWIPVVDGIEYNLVDGRQRCLPILAIFPNGRCDQDGLMYAWSGWGLIWRSDDFGANWSQMTDRDDEWPWVTRSNIVPTIVVNESGLVFFGADNGGLFVSKDNGDNWLPIGGRHPDYLDDEVAAHYRWWHDQFGGIFDLSFDDNGYLIIGTWDGAIRSTIPMNGVIEEPNSVLNPDIQPKAFLLSVYPNPFNGILRVNINAEQNQPYSVSIFDNTGRLVSVLSKGIGSSQLVWDASNNPSGLYWVQSVVNNKNLTKGVYLVR